MKDKDQNMYLNKSLDQFGAFLQVLQPIFSLWAIMAHTRVITSFQSSCGIGLTTYQISSANGGNSALVCGCYLILIANSIDK